MKDAKNFGDLVDVFLGLINLAIPLVFAIAILVVLWKVVSTWIIGGGDPNKIEEGKKTVLVAIIALVVMSSVWGIVKLLQSSIFF